MAERLDSDEEETIAQDVVVTKYKMAGDIANRVLLKVIEKTVAGAEVIDVCSYGDSLILEEVGAVFKNKKEMKKGIAFPTCLSVNHCVGNFSPLKSDPPAKLNDGDLVKIELGAHIDGFMGVVAHTLVIGSSPENPVTGRKADVIQAGHIASELALRMMKPGGENMVVTDTMQKVAAEFDCIPIEGTIWHQFVKGDYTDEKCVLLNMTEAMRKEYKKAEFGLHEVYEVNILISTGEGKAKQSDARTTVYKRSSERYNLKMKASKAFFSEVQSRFDRMPFSLRSFEEEGKARLAIPECVSHNLLEPYNILYEKEGEFVAHFRYTVLLMANGPLRITSGPFDQEVIKSDKSLQDEELKKLLATSVSKKKKKNKKKVIS